MTELFKDKVAKKITEYNLPLLSDYPTQDKGHCFITAGMIIFTDNEDKTIAVTFQADQLPEDVATYTLILSEIQEAQNIFVMDSFIYDSDDKYISGAAAHKLVRETIISQAFKKVATYQLYEDILKNSKCFEC